MGSSFLCRGDVNHLEEDVSRAHKQCVGWNGLIGSAGLQGFREDTPDSFVEWGGCGAVAERWNAACSSRVMARFWRGIESKSAIAVCCCMVKSHSLYCPGTGLCIYYESPQTISSTPRPEVDRPCD
jgi:hypothetical protein